MNPEPLQAVQAEAANLGLSLTWVRQRRHCVLRVSLARAELRRLARHLGNAA